MTRGDAPLVISLPHTGTMIPDAIASGLVSLALGRQDTDWWIERLYDFAAALGATVIHTAVSRTVIDLNRDPSGGSLYPGQATTALCPLETFDGAPLYRPGAEPSDTEVERRRQVYFEPYHAALRSELDRLRGMHRRVVLYDCHSIRSIIPRLFAGELPHFNIGTHSGASCDPGLAEAVFAICAGTPFSVVLNGRFKGGWITRTYGRPAAGVHAVQMELACRGYLREPAGPVTVENWPRLYDDRDAAPMRAALRAVLHACLSFAASQGVTRAGRKKFLAQIGTTLNCGRSLVDWNRCNLANPEPEP